MDRPTDVLSFPMFDLSPGEKPGKSTRTRTPGWSPWGTCASLERAAAQAGEFGHSVERELSYLTVHSVLHLLGYDHMDEGPMKAFRCAGGRSTSWRGWASAGDEATSRGSGRKCPAGPGGDCAGRAGVVQ